MLMNKYLLPEKRQEEETGFMWAHFEGITLELVYTINCYFVKVISGCDICNFLVHAD